MKNKTFWIAETAVMIALLVALQWATKALGQFVTGSCVNLCCLRSARMFSASLICISIPPDASIIVSDTAPE